MLSRRALVTLAALAVLTDCTSAPQPPVGYSVVAVSDIHFDPFFDPALFPRLQAAPESEWARLFEESGHDTPGRYGGTTNYTLLRRMVTTLQAQQPRPTLVLFGGDILVQGFPDLFYLLNESKDEAALRAFALKTVTFVVHQIRSGLGAVPVHFTLGNWDNYAGSFELQPDDPFLADTASLFYDDLLVATANRAAFDATYRAGGYYAAEVPGTDLVVIGLNTLFLAQGAPSGIDAAVDRQFTWLAGTLSAVETSGRRAWILTHVPPGGDLATTGKNVDPQGHVTQASMMMQATPQQRLLRILDAHRSTIAAAFTGHTHMDEYRIAALFLQGLPGITAAFENSPAFKTFSVSTDGTLLDYVSWALDLTDASATFQPSYAFSSAYGFPAPLDAGQARLFPALVSSPAAQAGYRQRYGSGHTTNPPLTNQNWPVYWCGIAFMSAEGLQGCVNGQ